MTHPSQDALQREQLKDALHSFSSASERLETAYARLEAEVGSLKAALATTTDERDAALARSANAGTRRSKVDAALSRHQRLAALGEMAATLAHQIRTPLSAALLYTSNAANPAIPPPRRDELLSRAIGCLNNLEHLVGDMLGFARGAVASNLPVELADIATATENAAAALLRPGQKLEVDPAPADAIVCGNREALVGTLLNLITNGLQAAGPSAVVRLGFSVSGNTAELRISDNGPGVPPGLHNRIFEPFFTSRSDGTGLGLAVVQSVARAHGGDVHVENTPPQGASFVLRLPLSSALSRLPNSETQGRPGHPNTATSAEHQAA
ncbi:MAG: two-component system, sensor histidine kinase FlrB [Pseudomonadota bacterium]|nr:two-component system, sensor histidine kinase FlrB [Pseudomonadota bacterium]